MLMVVEGGHMTLPIILEAVTSQTPVIVIKGSGKAADFVALGYSDAFSKKSEGKPESEFM